MVSGGHGDVNSHTMYFVRVASHQRGKFEILVVSVGVRNVNSHTTNIVRVALCE